jgi:hypothetical protein
MAARKKVAKAAKARKSAKTRKSAKARKSAKTRKSAKAATTAKSAKSATQVLGGACTLVYVHGIGNKPTEDVLRCQWDQALMGFGLGERSRMAYWCQRDRHGPPTGDSCKDPGATGASPRARCRTTSRSRTGSQT